MFFFLSKSDGFVLENNRFDQIRLDNVILPKLSTHQRQLLEQAGYLGYVKAKSLSEGLSNGLPLAPLTTELSMLAQARLFLSRSFWQSFNRLADPPYRWPFSIDQQLRV